MITVNLCWLDTSGNLEGINYYYVNKYKVKQGESGSINEFYTPLRLAEQYLIRAEARANQGKLAEAIDDINIIRNRANLAGLSSGLDESAVATAIDQENRIEFLVEYGHRWLDLKRLGRAGEVLSPLKGADWQLTDQLFPIPLSEIQKGSQPYHRILDMNKHGHQQFL